jgi:hypothetical protein
MSYDCFKIKKNKQRRLVIASELKYRKLRIFFSQIKQTCAESHFFKEKSSQVTQKSSHDFDFFQKTKKSQSHDFDFFQRTS